MKRIVSIQDISCVGKCSLTVALPIISSMGVETSIVPTAVLSTHTQFKGFTFRDLTDDMLPILDHWKKEGFKFDYMTNIYKTKTDKMYYYCYDYGYYADNDFVVIVRKKEYVD